MRSSSASLEWRQMLSVLWLSALAPPLTPPRVSGRGAGWVEVAVQLDEVSLTVLEGDVSVQDELVDSALTVDDSAADEDPYGVVLWPAAQAVARELVALTDGSGEPLLRSGSVLLELGAGTGLCCCRPARARPFRRQAARDLTLARLATHANALSPG